jgi:hypothetical protein
MTFFLATQLNLYQVEISIVLRKLKLFVLLVTLAWKGNHVVLCKENNSNNKMSKVYNFRIKSETGKSSVEYYIEYHR